MRQLVVCWLGSEASLTLSQPGGENVLMVESTEVESRLALLRGILQEVIDDQCEAGADSYARSLCDYGLWRDNALKDGKQVLTYDRWLSEVD